MGYFIELPFSNKFHALTIKKNIINQIRIMKLKIQIMADYNAYKFIPCNYFTK